MPSITTSTLHALADLAAERLLPTPRGAATAATLRQVGDLVDGLELLVLVPGDLAAAFAILGEPRVDDPPPITARRTTCRELGVLAQELAAGREDIPTESPRTVIATWMAAAACMRADDPRQAAIAATLRREAQELGERLRSST